MIQISAYNLIMATGVFVFFIAVLNYYSRDLVKEHNRVSSTHSHFKPSATIQAIPT